ncbi:unnamed protein product [Macrosiphum euphorbiae]|uniref:Uncharacterized protein n=1 Tax=Macrosiphum euphorbiae TaxID=13131 RepID=A0AAV0XDQ4_9HEMI|nr:unnamed protein product [Macrosiphum euphorbiae]
MFDFKRCATCDLQRDALISPQVAVRVDQRWIARRGNPKRSTTRKRIYGCYSRLANRSQIQLGFVKQIYFTDTTRVWPLCNIPLYSNKDS